MEAGLSPLAAIQAATISGAELLGISARTGSVEPNMEADLIAVDGNPLTDIGALEHVSFVMRGGKVYKNVQ